MVLTLSLGAWASGEEVHGLWRSSSGAYLTISPQGRQKLLIAVYGSDGVAITTYKAAWDDRFTRFFYVATGGDRILTRELSAQRIKVEDALGDWSAVWSRPKPKELAHTFYTIYLKNRGSRGPVLERAGQLLIEASFLESIEEVNSHTPADKKWFDFDPFSNGHMDVAEFRVGEPKGGGAVARVPVELSFGGKGNLELALTLELRPHAGAWKITNFHYPSSPDDDAWDLKSWLKGGLSDGGTEL